MSLDILGPGSALNSVTTRPPQTTTYGATRTWFKNCSSLTAQDGTQLTNDWLNNILAQLRSAYDGSGIVEDNGDDMLWRTIEVMSLRYAVDNGAVNAISVTDTPPVPAYRAGLAMAIKIKYANTGATTISVDGISPLANALNADGLPFVGGELPANRVALFIMDDNLNFRLIAPSRRVTLPGFNNLTSGAPGGAKTATWTIGAIVADAPGGIAYRGDSLSLSFNGANVGADGMDTGSMPTSADLSVYAIYNPTTNSWATLGCAGSTSNGTVYSGSNMPSGYTASILISSLKVDSSGNIKQFAQAGRLIMTPYYTAIGGMIYPSGWASLSIASIVPANAKTCRGATNTGYAPDVAINVASDANGTNEHEVSWGTAVTYGDIFVPWSDLILTTPQTIYWCLVSSGTSNSQSGIQINGYTF